MKYAIGVDPGKAGWIAVINRMRSWPTVFGELELYKMPQSATDLHALMGRFPTFGTMVWIEDVHAFAKGGRTMGVTSAFTFGRGVGTIEGVLSSIPLTYEFVRPAVWQKIVGVCGKDGSDPKVRSHNAALRLFGNHPKLSKSSADAALIALAAVRSNQGVEECSG